MSNSILSPVDALRNLVAAVREVEGYWTETLANRMQDAEQTLDEPASGRTKYVVMHSHDHGISSFIVESDQLPSVKQVVRCLDLSFEPSKAEQIEIDALPSLEPVVLDWQEGDDEDFEEEFD